jgi:hypothetical protein
MAARHLRQLLYDYIRVDFPVMTLESHHHSLFTRQSRADSKVTVSAYTTFSDSTLSADDLVNSPAVYAGLHLLREQP